MALSQAELKQLRRQVHPLTAAADAEALVDYDHLIQGLVMMGMPHMLLSSREDIRTEVGTCAIKASKRLSAGSGRNLRNCVKYVPGVSHAR